MMLTSPRLSPAACFHNQPVGHALRNVSSSLDFQCPILGKTQELERLESETQISFFEPKRYHTGKCYL